MSDYRHGTSPSVVGPGPSVDEYHDTPTDLADCGLAYIEQPHPRERAYERARTQLAKKSPDAVSAARGVAQGAGTP